MQEEKAIFNINNTFYRSESKIVRDLGVLGAAIAQKEQGSLIESHTLTYLGYTKIVRTSQSSRYSVGSSGFCVETGSILIVSSAK
ncbi:hypothetical protein PN437_19120 [Microcystis aeruginosa CS-564/01]|nr:hypothetical protein [Microcystis aeruginosa]MDB9426975.1 hypothetical protein [Microcystis aeruginosa CS-564/01]